ncbi:MAG: hypothetical protein GXO43_04205 [Crenarchaeota archaeon]|nr:hypothetical protein [Thermoproteota archaeon]
MGPSGADIMFLLLLTVFAAVVVYVLWREARGRAVRDLKYAMVILAISVLSPIYYAVIAPYYTVVPTGEYVTYTVPSNVTTVVNGTTTTIPENITVVSQKYVVNPAPYSYFGVVFVFSMVLFLIAFYYIVKWSMRYSTR